MRFQQLGRGLFFFLFFFLFEAVNLIDQSPLLVLMLAQQIDRLGQGVCGGLVPSEEEDKGLRHNFDLLQTLPSDPRVAVDEKLQKTVSSKVIRKHASRR